jgi:acetyl esterase/lipase
MEFIAGSNVICICPNYPVLPWFDGSHIYLAVRKFWEYIHSDTFEADVSALQENIKFRRTNIIVSGDSAGSWLAMHSFLDPTLGPDSKPLDIAAVYMQYPMLRHYQRDYELDAKKVEEAKKDDKKAWSDEEKKWKSYKGEEGVTFMERSVYKKQITLAGAELKIAWKAWHEALKKFELSPFDIDINRPWAPIGMSAAFLSSHNAPMWKEFFQNGNTTLEYEDIPTRVAHPDTQADIKSRQRLPVIYVYHGTEDTNCPFEDTKKLVTTLKELYNENTKAKGQKVVDYFQFHPVPEKSHGWDHGDNVKDLPILVHIHKGLQDNHINKA